MKNTAKFIGLVGAMTLGLAATAYATETTKTEVKTETKSVGMEKCSGIAKAGKNDCKTAANSCAGQGKEGGWLNLPAGTCAKIKGGTVAS